MTAIRQMQVSYDPLEDRVLLRIAMTNKDEFRVFLTRRLLRVFWPHLQKIVQHRAMPLAGSETLPGNENFATPFDEHDANFPLGSNPLLVSEASFDAEADNAWRITFRERRGRGIALHFSPGLLETLRAMLAGTLQGADWDLAPAAANSSEAVVPSHLH